MTFAGENAYKPEQGSGEIKKMSESVNFPNTNNQL
jgi:hypothetical protein